MSKDFHFQPKLNIPDLPDNIAKMFEGFIERHGEDEIPLDIWFSTHFGDRYDQELALGSELSNKLNPTEYRELSALLEMVSPFIYQLMEQSFEDCENGVA